MTPTETYLSQQQLARAEALDRSRAVLVARAPLTSGKVEFPYELVGLARYVIDGTDLFNTEDADGAVAE
jgi:hypothetical protein